MDQPDAFIILDGGAFHESLSKLWNQVNVPKIACDGAANELQNHSLVPTIIVGDMDSIVPATLDWASSNGCMILNVPQQENSDFAKALDVCQAYHWQNIIVIGGYSIDFSHTMSNLLTAVQSPLTIEFRFQNQSLHILKEHTKTTFETKIGTTFSVFAFTQPVVCSIIGAKYELNDATLHPGSQGLHNRCTSPRVEIEIEQGTLLVHFFEEVGK